MSPSVEMRTWKQRHNHNSGLLYSSPWKSRTITFASKWFSIEQLLSQNARYAFSPDHKKRIAYDVLNMITRVMSQSPLTSFVKTITLLLTRSWFKYLGERIISSNHSKILFYFAWLERNCFGAAKKVIGSWNKKGITHTLLNTRVISKPKNTELTSC